MIADEFGIGVKDGNEIELGLEKEDEDCASSN